MGKRMADCAVDGKCGPNTYTGHHEAQLVIETIRKYTAQIVFDYRIKNWECGHCYANPYQDLGSSITPC